MPQFHYPQRQPRPTVGTTGDWGARKRDLQRRPEFARVDRGLWAKGMPGLNPLNPVERAALLQLHWGENFAVSGLSAARMWGLPVGTTTGWIHDALRMEQAPAAARFKGAATMPHLAWREVQHHHQNPTVSVMRALGTEPMPGLWDARVVHPLEALVRCEPMLSDWRIIACLDHMMGVAMAPGHKRFAPATAESLATVLAMLTGPARSRRRVAQLLTYAQPRTWSPMETLTRLLVVDRGLPAPAMNHEVVVADPPYHRTVNIDLAWKEARTGIEYNGAVHAQDPKTYRDEMHRLTLLRDDGWDIRVLVTQDHSDPVRRDAWLDWLAKRLG